MHHMNVVSLFLAIHIYSTNVHAGWKPECAIFVRCFHVNQSGRRYGQKDSIPTFLIIEAMNMVLFSPTSSSRTCLLLRYFRNKICRSCTFKNSTTFYGPGTHTNASNLLDLNKSRISWTVCVKRYSVASCVVVDVLSRALLSMHKALQMGFILVCLNKK